MDKPFKYNSRQPLVHRDCHQLPKPNMGAPHVLLMTKETSYTFDILRAWHLFNSINFSFVNFNASFRNFMSQDNAFINHKVALLPIQDKVSVFTSLQNSIKVA